MANNTNTQRLRIIKPETLKPVGSAQMQKEILALQKQLRQKNKELEQSVTMIEEMMQSIRSMKEKLRQQNNESQILQTVMEQMAQTQCLQAENMHTLVLQYVVTEKRN